MAETGKRQRERGPHFKKSKKVKLDWTHTFPVLVNDGKHGYEIFYLHTTHMKKRSTFFAKALEDFRPHDNEEIHGIEAPDFDVPTFEYYKRCVETGDATLNATQLTFDALETLSGRSLDSSDDVAERSDVAEDDAGSVTAEDGSQGDDSGSSSNSDSETDGEQEPGKEQEPSSELAQAHGEGSDSDVSDIYSLVQEEMTAAEEGSGGTAGGGQTEEGPQLTTDGIDEDMEENTKINDHLLLHCKGYFLATELGDCKTANLIIDAIIELSIQTQTLLNDDHIQRMAVQDLSDDPDAICDALTTRETLIHRRKDSPLCQLAVDMWVLASGAGMEYELVRTLPDWFQSLVILAFQRIRDADKARMVGEAFDACVIAGNKERYRCHNELHPGPQI